MGREADIEEWVDAVGVEAECEQSQVEPFTPQQKQHIDRYEEVSPTDTDFSIDKIFDSPISLFDSGRKEDYAETDVSSLDNEDEARNRKEFLASVKAPDDVVAEQESQSTKPLSKDPDNVPKDSAISSTPTPETARALILKPSPIQPPLIRITSCMQCTLASLPCTRTLPACRRCVRNGNPTLCLLHRRPVRSEMLARKFDPILLKARGDDDAVWKQKLELYDDLLTSWLQREYRKNWVLPTQGVPFRGDWRRLYKYFYLSTKRHPGEGSGPTRDVRVWLAEE